MAKTERLRARVISATRRGPCWHKASFGTRRCPIGEATFAISVVVLLAWFLLLERPGFGTFTEVAAAIAAVGAGSGLYLTTLLGLGRATA